MIAARDFAHRDQSTHELGYVGAGDGLNDGLWCQSAMNVSGIGSWKLPNGNAVSDNLEFDPIHMAKRPGQVGLLRSTAINYSPYQGMYTCTITDENDGIQTLVVWTAGVSAYDGSGSNREFNIEQAVTYTLNNCLLKVHSPYITKNYKNVAYVLKHFDPKC